MNACTHKDKSVIHVNLRIGKRNQKSFQITFYIKRNGKLFVDIHQYGVFNMLYIHLEKQIFKNSMNDKFNVATAKTVEEAFTLIAVGFSVVHEYQGVIIYRKRK